MNLALSSIIIILFLFPGFVSFRAYYSNKFSSRNFKAEFSQLVLSILLPAIIIHVLFILIIRKLNLTYQPNLKYIGLLLTCDDAKEIKEIFSNISNNIKYILIYQISITLFAAASGISMRFLIRILRLDRYFTLLRYPNRWHYILTGELLNVHSIISFSKKQKKVKFKFIDILTETNNKTILYSGILHNYLLTKDDIGVEYIKLIYAQKKEFSTTDSNDKKPIRGNYFIIPFKNVKNINITYYFADSNQIKKSFSK